MIEAKLDTNIGRLVPPWAERPDRLAADKSRGPWYFLIAKDL